MSARRAPHEPARPATVPAPPGAPAAAPGDAGREWPWVLLLAVGYVAVYQSTCVTKFRYYLYTHFDLAIFTQAIHGVMSGSFFSSIRGMNWIGDHSSLILVPLAPLFALAPHPVTLLAVQTAALAAGAVPVWLLARREGLPSPMPVACAALYLLHPALGYLNLFEFHPEALAVPSLLWCALEVRAGRTLRAGLAAALALLTREDVPLPVFGLALVALLARPRNLRLAVVLGTLAAGSLLLSFAILKPWLLEGQADYGRMYARWGSSAGGIALGILSRPVEALAALFSTPGNAADSLAKQQMWLHLLLPVGGLALLAPRWLLPALPVLAEHLLSDRPQQHSIVFQYAALSLPFVVVAAVAGLGAWTRRAAARGGRTAPAASAVALVALALATQWMFGPVVGRRIAQAAAPSEAIAPDAFDRAMKPRRDSLVARLPESGPIAAGFEFLPHLAQRRDVHSLHHVATGTYTYSSRPYPAPGGTRAILADMTRQIPNLGPGSGRRLRALAAERGLRPVAAAEGTLLMLPPPADPVPCWSLDGPEPVDRLDLVIDERLLLVGAGRVDAVAPAGGVARFESSWRRIGPVDGTYLAQVWLAGGDAIALRGQAVPLGHGFLPAADWPADRPVRTTVALVIPEDLAAGEYTPLLHVVALDAAGRPRVPQVRAGDRIEPLNVIEMPRLAITARDPAAR